MADADERPGVTGYHVRTKDPLAQANCAGRVVLVALAVLILVVLGVAYWDGLGRSDDGASVSQAGRTTAKAGLQPTARTP